MLRLKVKIWPIISGLYYIWNWFVSLRLGWISFVQLGITSWLQCYLLNILSFSKSIQHVLLSACFIGSREEGSRVLADLQLMPFPVLVSHLPSYLCSFLSKVWASGWHFCSGPHFIFKAVVSFVLPHTKFFTPSSFQKLAEILLKIVSPCPLYLLLLWVYNLFNYLNGVWRERFQTYANLSTILVKAQSETF